MPTKNSKKFECKSCDFICSKQFNYYHRDHNALKNIV